MRSHAPSARLGQALSVTDGPPACEGLFLARWGVRTAQAKREDGRLLPPGGGWWTDVATTPHFVKGISAKKDPGAGLGTGRVEGGGYCC